MRENEAKSTFFTLIAVSSFAFGSCSTRLLLCLLILCLLIFAGLPFEIIYSKYIQVVRKSIDIIKHRWGLRTAGLLSGFLRILRY